MKNFIAPLIWGVVAVVFISLYYSIFVPLIDSPIAKIVYIIGVVIIIIAMGVTLKRRFKEIKEEEKDDLSKY
jgi:high-affinity Fe2+/Pb2+ permease